MTITEMTKVFKNCREIVASSLHSRFQTPSAQQEAPGGQFHSTRKFIFVDFDSKFLYNFQRPGRRLEEKDLKVPQCYFPEGSSYTHNKTANSNKLKLKRNPSFVKNPFGNDYKTLQFTEKRYGATLNLKITPKNKRYEPPIDIPKGDSDSLDGFDLIMSPTFDHFSFAVRRQSSGVNIWDTSIGGLFFSDQFIQIATYLSSDKLYGFGENIHQTLKHNFTTYTTWGMNSRDRSPDSKNPNVENLYGVQPFYLALEPDGNAHGVFILNSNSQEVTTGPGPHLVYRTIGGLLDLYFFPGPKPEHVIKQYLALIGKPALPAYWALGFQIYRYGYKNVQEVREAVEGVQNAGIPVDVTYADIDYMDVYKDFTLGPNWKDFSAYTDEIHEQGLKLILIWDPAIEATYPTFRRGIDSKAKFIEWPRADLVQRHVQDLYLMAKDTNIMLGVVWPNQHAAFPDFLDPSNATNEWWIKEFEIFHDKIAFDGAWIDMNEPVNFDTNDNSPWLYYSDNHPKSYALQCPQSGNDSKWDVPNYETINVYQWQGREQWSFLASKTLCMFASTGGGSHKFYDTKNLYGWSEARATQQAIHASTKERGVVISRSTFPSSGRFGGHWLGDNTARWEDLRTSIIGVMEFNMFGIPYVGADICGFIGATTEELCLRWQQLGAFHSFSRNHNDINYPLQTPDQWPSVAEATRKANLFRYRHLPYLYTLHFEACLNGGTVVRPPFFEFAEDEETHTLNYQFMWGSALMVVPVVFEGATSVEAYLPKSEDEWYSMYDWDYGREVPSGWHNFTAPQDYLIPVFMRVKNRFFIKNYQC
ncbi:hypothetical protein L596_021660 [Steinernema carpocapsae]|uniref:Glycoside hydrolase family 31 N-terminal domain-containing protein n=1 Tax=Steinernema carpocapsae TaxID=34508 RepID=A0A4U5MJI1_STECR|nr:hypothetical protein L596_021660 [Steinernema carpocapsae]